MAMNARDESYMKLKGYQVQSLLGVSMNGAVYLIYNPQYSKYFALKSILSSRFRQNEFEAIKEIDDPSFIGVYNYDYFEGSVYLLMEFCPNSLEKLLRSYHSLPSDILYKYSLGLLRCLRVCHSRNLPHLDLKPSNFLIDDYDRTKLCDFGFNFKLIQQAYTQESQSFSPYIAPELYTQTEFDPFKADIWSVGMILYVMATGTYPWSAYSLKDFLSQVNNTAPNTDLVINPELYVIIRSCLSLDPKERPTIDQLLNQPIFRMNVTSIKQIKQRASVIVVGKLHTRNTSNIIQPKTKRINLLHI